MASFQVRLFTRMRLQSVQLCGKKDRFSQKKTGKRGKNVRMDSSSTFISPSLSDVQYSLLTKTCPVALNLKVEVLIRCPADQTVLKTDHGRR